MQLFTSHVLFHTFQLPQLYKHLILAFLSFCLSQSALEIGLKGTILMLCSLSNYSRYNQSIYMTMSTFPQ